MKTRLQLKAVHAFTLIEIMIVVAIIGLLAAMAIPSLRKNTSTARLGAIQHNLLAIDNAKTQWMVENKKGEPDVPTERDVASYMKGNKMPADVIGETYNINAVDQPASAIIKSALGDYPANSEITAPS